MTALLIAAAGMAFIGGLFAAVTYRQWHRISTYSTDHAAAGPLLDRTEAPW